MSSLLVQGTTTPLLRPTEAVSNNKKIYISCIAAGIIIFLGMNGFGTIGLLKSHKVISWQETNKFLKFLSKAIKDIGDAGLLGIISGGTTVGGSLIIFGSWNIHKIKSPSQTKYQEFEKFFNQSFGPFEDNYEKFIKGYSDSLNVEQKKNLEHYIWLVGENQCARLSFRNNKGGNVIFVIAQKKDGEKKLSAPLTQEAASDFVAKLKQQMFIEVHDRPFFI